MDDHRRSFESAKHQGASRSHWLGFDDLLRNELMNLLELRKRLHDEAPSRPDAQVRQTLKEQLEKINADIERINDVRRDVAAELESVQNPEGGWGA